MDVSLLALVDLLEEFRELFDELILGSRLGSVFYCSKCCLKLVLERLTVVGINSIIVVEINGVLINIENSLGTSRLRFQYAVEAFACIVQLSIV